MNIRGLQAVTGAMGALALITGGMAIVGGPEGMPDGQVTTATVDSEVRFMASYWLGHGAGALYLAPRVTEATAAYRAWLAVMATSGLARVVSYIKAGRPHPVMVAATGVQLMLPPILWAWQAKAAAAAGHGAG